MKNKIVTLRMTADFYKSIQQAVEAGKAETVSDYTRAAIIEKLSRDSDVTA